MAFSSGNHAQGVAAAAQIRGLPAVIVMPADAPGIKIANTRSYGAEVILYDRHREDREQVAARLAAERAATLVRPYDDPDIIAGQGTIGLEIARQCQAKGAAPDIVLEPLRRRRHDRRLRDGAHRAAAGREGLRRRARRGSTIPRARSPPTSAWATNPGRARSAMR